MTRAAIVAIVLAACSHADPKPPLRTAVVARDAAPMPPAPAALVIPTTSTMLLTAVTADWSSTTAELRLWRRAATGWSLVDTWPGVIGKAGAAWGIGLHGDGAPAGRSGPRKHEGDGASPAGAFALRQAYGYAASPPSGTALAYTPLDAGWQCVDDPASQHYTQILDRGTVDIDWHSAETMRRPDALYTWVVDVAHNPSRVAGAGSCIFLHVWHGPDSVTVGCTAMAPDRLGHLLATLEPSTTFVLLPRAEYAALAATWALPPQN